MGKEADLSIYLRIIYQYYVNRLHRHKNSWEKYIRKDTEATKNNGARVNAWEIGAF